MSYLHRSLKSFAAALAFALLAGISQAPAQPAGPDSWFGGRSGMMMGPWAMGRSQFRGLCSPRGLGFAEWRIRRIERLLQLTDAQKPKFDDLKKATEKAMELVAKSCPDATPATPPARLEFMEKRAEATLEGIKIVRPAFAAFYDTLTDEQKAHFAERRRGRGPGR